MYFICQVEGSNVLSQKLPEPTLLLVIGHGVDENQGWIHIDAWPLAAVVVGILI